MTAPLSALDDPGWRPLPPDAARLLRDLGAPPRLAAHLRVVHDAACELLAWTAARYPAAEVDADAVAFGAAVHDIGKVLYPAELSSPGNEHEPAGERLLRDRGVDARLARFARTHAAWDDDGLALDDLLVALADKVWKAKRVPDLERRVVTVLSAASGEPEWETFLALDDALTRIAGDADARLAFQSAYPVGHS
ncbi:HD domain-containing protein [Spirillospora sp. CA-294931]|uniref:HD domain-containing protein n=1 Tax=Spirillospora sp. CA-294931 TaxID=3240042 RepID=UPI003D8B0267